jgi:hypothetical protein
MILNVLTNYSAVLYYNLEYFAYCDSVWACRVFMTSGWPIPAIVQCVLPHLTPRLLYIYFAAPVIHIACCILFLLELLLRL